MTLRLALLPSLLAFTVAAAPPPGVAVWTTLGTNSGPIPDAKRSEPANLLQVPGDEPILIDAGAGASEQLVKGGVPLANLHWLLLSHLHFDHTGGLLGIIAQRYQMVAPGVLTIYGPPGTKTLVDGIVAGMASAPPSGPTPPGGADKYVQVVEVDGGSTFTIGKTKITAVRNTHYSTTSHGNDYVSLAYRFDTPGRSITFTGDTGPSEAVEKLARGSDLLVSEIISPTAFDEVKAARPDLPAPALAQVKEHFEHEHLSPDQVGLMASRAGVQELVLTHDAVDPAKADALLQPGIAAHYRGPTRFATDLARF